MYARKSYEGQAEMELCAKILKDEGANPKCMA